MSWNPQGTSWNEASHQIPRVDRESLAAPRRVDNDPEAAAQDAGAPTIENFRRRKNPLKIISLIVLAISIVAAMVWFANREEDPEDEPTSEPTPTRTVQPPPQTPGSYADSAPFESQRVAGEMRVTESHWEGGELFVTLEVTLTRGSMEFRVLAIDVSRNGGGGEMTPVGTDPYVREGETYTGTFSISKLRNDTQVSIFDRNNQSSALAGVRVEA